MYVYNTNTLIPLPGQYYKGVLLLSKSHFPLNLFIMNCTAFVVSVKVKKTLLTYYEEINGVIDYIVMCNCMYTQNR